MIYLIILGIVNLTIIILLSNIKTQIPINIVNLFKHYTIDKPLQLQNHGETIDKIDKMRYHSFLLDNTENWRSDRDDKS